MKVAKDILRGCLMLAFGAAWALTVLPTGAGAAEAVADAGAGAVGTAQVWIDFIIRNGANLAAIVGIIGGIILAVRAQVRAWRADAAGKAVTAAVTAAGVEGLVRPVMDAATPAIKAKVWSWVKRK